MELVLKSRVCESLERRVGTTCRMDIAYECYQLMSVHRVNTEGSDTIPLYYSNRKSGTVFFSSDKLRTRYHQIGHKDVNTEQQNDATLHV